MQVTSPQRNCTSITNHKNNNNNNNNNGSKLPTATAKTCKTTSQESIPLQVLRSPSLWRKGKHDSFVKLVLGGTT
eukprot:622428-Amphidinium_carterae.1